MSNQRVTGWVATSNNRHIRTASTIQPMTTTYIHYLTSTVIASPIPTASQSLASAYDKSNVHSNSFWEGQTRRLFPAIITFAIIGVLTVIGSLLYLGYRLYQANSKSQQRRRQNAELNFNDENNKKASSPLSATLSNVIPWLAIPSPLHPTEQNNDIYINYQPQQREPIRFEKTDVQRIIDRSESSANGYSRRPSLAPSWLTKLIPAKLSKNTTPRHMSLPAISLTNDQNQPNTINNLNVPISSTFVPIDTSSLTLVPRSEIWLDPGRRRGVDELDIWERKKSSAEIQTIVEEQQTIPLKWKFQPSDAYPESPESSERRFAIPQAITGGDVRSVHVVRRHSISHRSSTTTVQDCTFPPSSSDPYGNSSSNNYSKNHQQLSRSKSETARYDESNFSDEEREEDEYSALASTSVSYPDALAYRQEVDEDDVHDQFPQFSITVKLPRSKQEKDQEHQDPESSSSNNNKGEFVSLVRRELEDSKLKNSSSQWLQPSGSKSF